VEMIKFRILKKSKKNGARLGILKTKNGVVETPCLVPVATHDGDWYSPSFNQNNLLLKNICYNLVRKKVEF